MGYKMIIDGSIVDADMNPCYAKYNAKLNMFLECAAGDAQYVSSRNGETWWHLPGSDCIDDEQYQTVELVEADDNEVQALMAAFEARREPIKIEIPLEEIVVEEIMSDDALVIIKEHLITQLSQMRELKICDGFDVVLSDGVLHHFSLSQDDHLNLLSLDGMRSMYSAGIPYQADNEPMRLYSEEDFNAILAGAAACRAKHYVYCKNLCAYVNTLETLAEFQGVFYGMEIPSEFQILTGKKEVDT